MRPSGHLPRPTLALSPDELRHLRQCQHPSVSRLSAYEMVPFVSAAAILDSLTRLVSASLLAAMTGRPALSLSLARWIRRCLLNGRDEVIESKAMGKMGLWGGNEGNGNVGR